MGRRTSVLTLVVINIIVTLLVVLVVFTVVKPQFGSQPPQQIPMTVQILITATTDPNATPAVKIITATPMPGTPNVVQLPTGLIDEAGSGGTLPPIATIDPNILNGDSALQLTATALPPNCVLHTVEEGETPFGIAQQYGADGFQLLAVNGLDENGTRNGVYLQIGDVLIVPLPGCALAEQAMTATQAATQEPTLTATTAATTTATTQRASPTPTFTPSRTPTATLPPTATNAQVEIVRVVSPGDINAEGVGIRNNGAVVDLTGWTLSTSSGDHYTFPQQRLFTGSELTVYTKVGTDTPTAKFWGLDTALWSSGSTLTLSDSNGKVQSTYIVP